MNDYVGTPAFRPPECWGGAAYRPKPVDIWSLGISIYCLVYEKLPYETNNIEEEIKKEFNIPFGSEELRQVLKATLEKDPELRATIT